MGGVIHNEKYWNINPKDKFDLGLPKHFTKLYYIFDLFMSDKCYIKPPHSQDFMKPNDDIYHVQPSFYTKASTLNDNFNTFSKTKFQAKELEKPSPYLKDPNFA